MFPYRSRKAHDEERKKRASRAVEVDGESEIFGSQYKKKKV